MRKVLPGKQKCNVTFEISLGVRTIILDDYTVRDARIVESEIRRQGLRVKVESVDSSIYEIGYVIKTDPVAGTEVKEDDMITIYVSRGASTESTMVPNFVG
ncbi:MAG: PASTA domain-containing protein, partial [Clostridia bacterium]|nr:PASTA domain-containing protein [Clostridia bacterium]